MQIVFRTFTIWVMTALINAIISAACLYFSKGIFEDWPLAFVLAFVFTLLFSLPSLLVFFIIFIAAQKADGEALFRRLLGTGWIMAIISGVIFCTSFYSEFNEVTLLLGFSIFAATTTSILLHHRFIVAICNTGAGLYTNHHG